MIGLESQLFGPGRAGHAGGSLTGCVQARRRAVTQSETRTIPWPSQLGPLARPGPEAAVEIVIAECSAILLWPF